MSIERVVSMFKRRTWRKIRMLFLIGFLFMHQTMILVAKEEFLPYDSDMDELLEEIREQMATSKEDFVVYISSELSQCEEFAQLRKYLFPVVRSGNYYSTAIHQISISISGTQREEVKKLHVKLKRTDSLEEYQETMKLVKEIADEINKSAKNDYERIKLTHDTLVKRIEYANGYQGAYAALNKGKAVCSGYAAAFQLIMDELGIPCKMVVNDEINHIWNCVYLDEEWYHVDVTWDDVSGKAESVDYRYFLKSKEDFYHHGELPDYTAKEAYVPEPSDIETKNGWKQEGEELYYYLDDKIVTGWLYHEGKWYYFKQDGTLQRGWMKMGKIWYYLGEDGARKTFFFVQENIFRRVLWGME